MFKVRLGSYIVQKANIRYDWVFNSIENAEYGTAGVLFY